MAAAPTVLKGVKIAKDVAEAGEVAQGLKKAEGAVVGTEKTAQEVKKVEDAGSEAAKVAKAINLPSWKTISINMARATYIRRPTHPGALDIP